MLINTLSTELFEEISKIPCINSHSHIILIAFGDDLTYVEAVCGHLKMARQNFAIVLAEMIEEGLISESITLDVAQATFHDNPAKVYGMD